MTTATRRTLVLLSALAAYAAAVVFANVLTSTLGLVPVGFGLKVTAGTYAAGLALVLRDVVQRLAGPVWSLVAIGAGIVVSFALADPFVATASAVAFGTAEIVDLLIFTPTNRARGFVPAALLSNLVSAPVDTFVFLWVAGFPVTLVSVSGQLVGKVLWATIVPLVLIAAIDLVLRRRRRTAARRDLVDA